MMCSLVTAVVPPPASDIRVTVVIPARDEAASIEATLAALAGQRGFDDRALPLGFFDIIVLANNCSDETADVVRSFAARTPALHAWVIEKTFEREGAHIGTARKYVMDLAAARFYAAGMPDGIIASLDSDTIADERWIAAIAREMRGCDAVAGHVTIAPADQERLMAPVRLLYARELAYRRVFAEVESLIDPLPENPHPRHATFVGASFGVTARCYFAAGGLPPVRRLEDFGFSLALRRIDARIRYSPLVRAVTSARQTARVDGGFGTFIAELHEHARRGESFTVEHPLRTLENIESRAAIRRIWYGNHDRRDVATAAAIFNLRPDRWLGSIDPAVPLGAVYERLAQQTEGGRRPYPQARVEVAIATLRAAVTVKSRQRTIQPEIAAGSVDAG